MNRRVSDEFSRYPEDERGVYSIGTVAGMLDVHEQSLRQYERLGLVVPKRTKGNTRMYSKKDVELLETVLNLTQDMGVNLAGVEIILRMRGKIEKLQAQMRELLVRFREHLAHEYDEFQEEMERETAIVPAPKVPHDIVKSKE